MKKSFLSLLAIAAILATGCKDTKPSSENTDSSPSSSDIEPSETSSTDPSSSSEEDQVTTYIDWDFDSLALGEPIPYTTYDYYEGSDFVASSIDEDGDVWVQAKDINDGARWALMSVHPKDRMGRDVEVKNFEIHFTTRLPLNQTGYVSDGGITLCNTEITGRYDLAFNYNSYSLGKDSAINMWYSIQTENGPVATTQNNETWGDRGSGVTNFEFYPGVEYDVSVCCKYEGEVGFGEEAMTVYVFVNNNLLIAKNNVPYMSAGGFGLRGATSGWEYGEFQMRSFPAVCPDGVDHYSETEFTPLEKTTFRTLAKPTCRVEDSLLSWDPVKGATAYDLYCNNTFVTRITGESYDISQSLSGKGKASLVAICEDFTINNSFAEEFSYALPTRLDTPVLQYRYSQQKIVWNAIENASGYQVYCGNTKVADLTNAVLEFDVSLYEDGEFTVIAIGDDKLYLPSMPSNVVSLKGSLGTPILTYDGEKLSWELDERATGYTLYKDGQVVANLDNTTNSYATTEVGEYTVKALGDGENCFDSELSSVYKIREIKTYYNQDYKTYNEVGKVVNIYSEWKDWSEWTVKEIEDDGTTWIGTSRPDLDWSAVWFPVLDSSNQYLNNYEYAADVKFRNVENNNNIMQMCFGTKGSNGRFAVEICAGGQFSTIGLYTNECHIFVTNFNIDWDVSHRVYINYSKQASGKARVSCLIDNQLVFDLDGLVAAIGDFGLCSIRKSDVYFTNVTVKDIPNVSTDGKCYL